MGASAPCLDTPGSGVDSTPKPVTLTGLEAEHGGTSRRIIGGWKCAAFLGILPRRWPGPPRRHPGLPREEASSHVRNNQLFPPAEGLQDGCRTLTTAPPGPTVCAQVLIRGIEEESLLPSRHDRVRAQEALPGTVWIDRIGR